MRFPRQVQKLLAILGVVWLLSACNQNNFGGLQRFPTARPTRPGQVETPTATPPLATSSADGTATPLVTAPPAVALPDETGITLACEANTLRIPVEVVGESGQAAPAAAVSRIAASGDWLYALIDSALYRAERLSVDAGAPQWEAIFTFRESVAGRPVQELLDLTVDPSSGLIYALDKAGHVYRFDAGAGAASLAFRASPSADEPDGLPYQFSAVTLDAVGRVVLLDTAHGVVWMTQGVGVLQEVNESRGLTSAADLTYAENRFYFVDHDGVIRTATGGSGSAEWRDAEGAGLALTLATSNHLGIEMLLLIDGARREVTGLLPGSGQVVTRHVFTTPGIGVLRDVTFSGGRLYAAADNALYVYPGPATGDSAECPPFDPEEQTRPSLYGFDALGLLNGAVYPIEGGSLPPWDRVYPGASRIYRLGVHHGLDIYGFNAPRGFGIGSPVLAIASGTVKRATIGYNDMSKEEFEDLLERSEAVGMTPPDILDRLEGKQVVIDHGNGVQSVYSHLDEIAPGVVTGANVRAGQIVGSVGVTGTQAEARPGTVGPHLHFEIWLGEYYLGHGITIRETMWWFEQVFDLTP